MDDSVILCDEFIYTEETKTIPKYVTFKTQNLSILLLFLLIAIALMIAVSIYCYLRKYQAKNYALDLEGEKNDSFYNRILCLIKEF